MENSYRHNSFVFIGSTSYAREYSANIHFNPLLVTYHPAPGRQDTYPQEVRVERLSSLYNNDEYMGSTSPYDDDGYEYINTI